MYKLILKYTKYRIVHLFVLIEFVNQFAMHRMNNISVYRQFYFHISPLS